MSCFRASEELAKAANVAVREVLAVKKGEHVLVVTNPVRDVYTISQAVYTACLRVDASPTLMIQPKKTSFDFAEPVVISAIKSEPDVVISISDERLGKDREALAKPYTGTDGRPYNHIFDQLLHGVMKIRAFWSPTVSTDMFVRTVPLDYAAMRRTSAKVAATLKNVKEVHVETALGTRVTVGVKGRKPMADDGDFRTPGKGGNLPAGEIFISPQLGASNGVIVFDGSITLDKTLVIKNPVKITLKRGFVTKIEGGKEAKQLENYVRKAEERPFEMAKKGDFTEEKAKEYSKNARNLGELGIGLNPKAKIVGNVLEDEKVLGTVHFALGSNYDQDALALIHSDGIVKNPTITIDGKTIMKLGKLLL